VSPGAPRSRLATGSPESTLRADVVHRLAFPGIASLWKFQIMLIDRATAEAGILLL